MKYAMKKHGNSSIPDRHFCPPEPDLGCSSGLMMSLFSFAFVLLLVDVVLHVRCCPYLWLNLAFEPHISFGIIE